VSAIWPTILVVDDEKNTREGLKKFLEGMNYDVFTAESAEEALRLIDQERPDIVLTDIRMPRTDGIALLEKIKAKYPEISVIVLTAYGTVENAVKAMKMGAFHYLMKPINLEELEFLIKKALTHQSLQQENRELRKELFRERFEEGDIIARSQKMKKVLDMVDRAAPSRSTVLLEGESGTGKELLAHRVHQKSPRRNATFLTLHCAALTETLLASELFGHEKGAFTGAAERKIGRFEIANGGTLFLDEVSEIPLEMQVKLLRVLQEGDFERVGGTKTIRADVRLVCATNRDLTQWVREGRFREDLFYRINVILVKVPPLRERRQDIRPLIEHFIRQLSRLNGKAIEGMDEEALKCLESYPWPGNVRELKNVLERMVVLSGAPKLTLENVPEDVRSIDGGLGLRGAGTGGSWNLKASNLQDMEKELIQLKLYESRGNKSKAAKDLGISRRTLYRKLEEYGLH
jgi:DNA-binding NtrC family response regulator